MLIINSLLKKKNLSVNELTNFLIELFAQQDKTPTKKDIKSFVTGIWCDYPQIRQYFPECDALIDKFMDHYQLPY